MEKQRGGANVRSFPALGTAKRPVLEISGNLLRPNTDGKRGCSVFLLDVCDWRFQTREYELKLII